jgi:hypothetical protein
VFRPPESADHPEIDVTAAQALVVVSLGVHVVQVETDEPRRHQGEMRPVLQEPHGLLDVGVAGIMPVTDGRIGREASDEFGKVRFERQFVELLTVFEPERDALLPGVVEHLAETVLRPPPERRHAPA